MKGTLTAEKHFVTFAFDPIVNDVESFGMDYAPELGYVWVLGFIDGVSYMVDILPMDEARHMYE